MKDPNNLDLSKLTAREVRSLYPDEEEPTDVYGCPAIDQTSAYRFSCTRPNHHTGPHVAYGFGDTEPYAIWYTDKPTHLLFDD